jgi:hypothetical protein
MSMLLLENGIIQAAIEQHFEIVMSLACRKILPVGVEEQQPSAKVLNRGIAMYCILSHL